MRCYFRYQGCKKTMTSFLGAFSCSLAHPEESQLPHCDLLSREAHVARHWGRLLPNSQCETEDLCPPAHKELSPDNHMSELGSRFLPSRDLTRNCSPGQQLDCKLMTNLEPSENRKSLHSLTMSDKGLSELETDRQTDTQSAYSFKSATSATDKYRNKKKISVINIPKSCSSPTVH